MQGRLQIVLAVAALMVLMAHVPTARAECCGPWYYYYLGFSKGYKERCADCTEPLGAYCGAKGGGGCNIFGCNCGGGCRQTVEGRDCTFDCCDIPDDRHAGRSRRQVTSDAIYTPTSNYSGHDVIVAGDLDKNGHLDEVEVHLYLTQRGMFVADVTTWHKLDSNSDGKLTAAEIDNDLRSIEDATLI